jgi:hypothetical protein
LETILKGAWGQYSNHSILYTPDEFGIEAVWSRTGSVVIVDIPSRRDGDVKQGKDSSEITPIGNRLVTIVLNSNFGSCFQKILIISFCKA